MTNDQLSRILNLLIGENILKLRFRILCYCKFFFFNIVEIECWKLSPLVGLTYWQNRMGEWNLAPAQQTEDTPSKGWCNLWCTTSQEWCNLWCTIWWTRKVLHQKLLYSCVLKQSSNNINAGFIAWGALKLHPFQHACLASSALVLKGVQF